MILQCCQIVFFSTAIMLASSVFAALLAVAGAAEIATDRDGVHVVTGTVVQRSKYQRRSF